MRNLFWWLVGGGALLALTAGAQAQAEKIGNLVVRIDLKPGTNSMVVTNALLNAILGVRGIACPTFPRVQSAVGVPGVTAQSIEATYATVWTHDVFGKIKEDVRACLLGYLQSVNANVVNVSAERIS